MDIYNHLRIFFEIVALFLQSYAFFLISCGLVHNLFCFLLPCLITFLAILRLRVNKPPNYRIKRILGSGWGLYSEDEDSCEGTQKGDAVKVIGHRACGLDAPENTISALNRMHLKGLSMVEFDVVLTADKQPVVFHDDNLCRTANVNKRVSSMTLKEIRELDVSMAHKNGANFRQERIPTLHEFVQCCILKDIKMIIDLKVHNDDMVKIINGLFKDYPKLYDLAIVSSFDPFVIYRIHANDPDIVCSLCWRPYYHSHEEYCGVQGPLRPRTSNPFLTLYYRFLNLCHYWFLQNFGYYFVGISAVLLSKDMITRNDIHFWKKRGIRLIAWSVNLPSEKQYFEKNLQLPYLTDTVINS